MPLVPAWPGVRMPNAAQRLLNDCTTTRSCSQDDFVRSRSTFEPQPTYTRIKTSMNTMNKPCGSTHRKMFRLILRLISIFSLLYLPRTSNYTDPDAPPRWTVELCGAAKFYIMLSLIIYVRFMSLNYISVTSYFDMLQLIE